jgi:hypothetical protein
VFKTAAFVEFETNLNAARQMVSAGRSLEALKVNAFEISDMYRHAWVHAVSALDHWVHQEIYQRAVALFASPGEKPDKLKRFPITVELFEKVHHLREPAETVFREQLEASLGYQSYQHPDKIKDAFALVSEIQLWREVADHLSQTNGTRVDATEIKDRLSHIATRRNKIAHEADRNPQTPNARRVITAADANQTIEFLHAVATAIVNVLDPGPEAEIGRSFLLVLNNGEAVKWVLEGSRMAFSEGARRDAEKLTVGDTLFITTTKECWGSAAGAATMIVGVAIVRTPAKALDEPLTIGSRTFVASCDLAVRGLAPFRRGVEFTRLVPHLAFIRKKAQWGIYLQRTLVRLPADDAETVRRHLAGLIGDPADYAGDYVDWRRGAA